MMDIMEIFVCVTYTLVSYIHFPSYVMMCLTRGTWSYFAQLGKKNYTVWPGFNFVLSKSKLRNFLKGKSPLAFRY